jgi:hypothetical protein
MAPEMTQSRKGPSERAGALSGDISVTMPGTLPVASEAEVPVVT